MSTIATAESPDAEDFDPVQDAFTLQLIRRKVRQIILRPEFNQCELDDLTQDLLATVFQSLQKYDPAVGHRYPFIATVVDRKVATIVKQRAFEMEKSGTLASLDVIIQQREVGPTELNHTISERELDRRLGRERVLSSQQLTDLRLDLNRVIARLPNEWRTALRLRKNLNPHEIAQEMKISLATVRRWFRLVRQRFEEAGLDEYFKK